MSRARPKVVVFDLGKVLLEFDYSIASKSLAALANVPAAEIHRILLSTPPLFEYETGLITSQKFYEAVCESTGFCGDFLAFTKAFGPIFTPIQEMIDLHGRLRKADVPCYIFSNTNELAIQFIRQTYAFFADFNGYILSYERGSMKPSPRIYEVVEEVTGCAGRDILYIDDRPENVSQGEERRWQAILHEQPTRSTARVREVFGNGVL